MDKELFEILALYLDDPQNEQANLSLHEYLQKNPQAVSEVKEYVCDHIALQTIFGSDSSQLVDRLSAILNNSQTDEDVFVAEVEKKISRKRPKTVVNISPVKNKKPRKKNNKKSKAFPMLLSFGAAAVLLFMFVIFSGSPQTSYELSLKDSQGEVELIRAEKVSRIAKGDEVKKGDVLKAGKGESLTLTSKDGNEIYLSSESEIEVRSVDSFYLVNGDAKVIAPKAMTFRTAFSDISSSSATYEVAAKTELTEVKCLDGAVKVVDALTRRFELLEINEVYTSPDRNSYLYRLEVVGLKKERKAVPFIESLEPGSSFKLSEMPEESLNLIAHIWYEGQLVKKDVVLQFTMKGPKDYVVDFRGNINTRKEASYPYCLAPDDQGLMPAEGWIPVKGKHLFRIDVMDKGDKILKSFEVNFEVK